MDMITHMLLVRDRQDDKTLGYDYPLSFQNWRTTRLYEIEDAVEQADWEAIGCVNYNPWDDFNYWEMKEDTIPWKGGGD